MIRWTGLAPWEFELETLVRSSASSVGSILPPSVLPATLPSAGVADLFKNN